MTSDLACPDCKTLLSQIPNDTSDSYYCNKCFAAWWLGSDGILTK